MIAVACMVPLMIDSQNALRKATVKSNFGGAKGGVGRVKYTMCFTETYTENSAYAQMVDTIYIWYAVLVPVICKPVPQACYSRLGCDSIPMLSVFNGHTCQPTRNLQDFPGK